MVKKNENGTDNSVKYSLCELLESNKIRPLYATGFITYYGLGDDFKKEFETGEKIIMFTEDEFKNMYEDYLKGDILEE